MPNKFVRICCDIHRESYTARWYRIYVNDEMFVERSFAIEQYQALRETLTLDARPGRYLVWARSSDQIKIVVRRLTVLEGSAIVESDQYIVIT